MNNFLRGGRGMLFGQDYVCSIMQNRERLLLPLGRYRSDVSRVTIIFCVLFSVPGLLGASALAQSQHRDKCHVFTQAVAPVKAEGKSYDYSLYSGVSVKPIVDLDILNKEREKYPKINFKKFPLQSFAIDLKKLPTVVIGDSLPGSLMDMPLRVVNDAYARDTITLRDCLDKDWVILDIWTEWCAPCIGSMNKWEALTRIKDSNFTLLGVYASFDAHRAMPESRNKGYLSTQIIGPATGLLTYIFFHGRGTLGPSIWIKKGKLFGISQAGALKEEDYPLLLDGKLDSIPAYAQWHPDNSSNSN